MLCPKCKGEKILHIAAVPGVHQQYDVECPSCEGTGSLPAPAQFPNNCPACGEPLPANEQWCAMHKEAANY